MFGDRLGHDLLDQYSKGKVWKIEKFQRKLSVRARNPCPPIMNKAEIKFGPENMPWVSNEWRRKKILQVNSTSLDVAEM